MNLDDITYVFAYRRDELAHLDEWPRLHNSAALSAIVDGFVRYS